ncbi:MAG: family 10 glycosylhydrolase [Cytophagales bacterium]|nr:family 10 glycosylhydrolase [Bernardetiaceae bacterium]MDW8205136.1 family 10 glycosylhydrolase [Cytophagales bacterium]
MKHHYLLCLFGLILYVPAAAQLPKREFRGVWIAHVNNIDWPSRKGLPARQQQQEFINLLDEHKRNGINAVVVQVRSACDAIYPSEIEPWSEWLTGKQGDHPGYDPLAFMIAETRKRGMEFHAWFNPFRAVTDVQSANIAPTHISVTRPEWILPYGNLRILNPGIPEVRAYILRVIMDVVRKYDIDAVHYDDYFYPYPVAGQVLDDEATFRTFGRGISNKDDWRRDNIDLFIRASYDSIRAAKPWVKFGVSPFGIWQNRSSTQPLGSATSGLQSYSAIYADSRKWVEQHWLDYIAPQLYWSIGFSAARYEVLLPWWAQNSFGRHLYIGQGAYRINESGSDANWRNPAQMPEQIRLNRRLPQVLGSLFFSSRSLLANPLGFGDSLRQDLFRFPALVPPMPWKDDSPPAAPQNLTAQVIRNSVLLTWNKPAAGTAATDAVRYFAVYRFEQGSAINLNDVRAIRIVTANDTTAFIDETHSLAEARYQYVVTAFDRLHNESLPSQPVSVVVTSSEAALAQVKRLFQNFPNPFAQETYIQYYLPQRTPVWLQVHDLTGKPISLLVEQMQESGLHEFRFDASDLPAGVYICTLRTTYMHLSIRMLLVK